MAGEQSIGKLIVRVLMDASGYKEEADKVTSKTSSMGDLLKKTADLIGGAFVTAAKAATAAAAGLAAASAVVGSNFEQAIAKVAAVKGIDKASDDFARLEGEARRLGAATMFSASEAAAGMEELARAGLTTDEIIASSQKVLELAAGSSISLADAATITAATMRQFGLEADDAGRITDVLTAATQNSLFGMQDLGEAMKFAGVMGANMGMSIEETTAAVAQFRNLGLEGSMAGTAFRMAMTQLAKPTDKAAEALAKYGIELADVNPETKSFRDIMLTLGQAGMSTGDAMQIFGAEAGAAAKGVADSMAASTTSFDSLLTTLEGAAGTTSETYAIMTDNVLGKFNEVKSAAEEVLIGLFTTYAAPLQDLLVSITNFVRLVGEEIAIASGAISGDMEGTLQGLADFIDQNAQKWAMDIAAIIAGAVSFGHTLSTVVIPALNTIIPLVDDIAIVLATIWATQRAMAFAAFITSVVIPAINATSFSLSGMATALAGATGGMSALAAGLAVLVTGLGVLIANLMSAQDETQKLADMQAAASSQISRTETQLSTVTERKLNITQDLLLAEKEALALAGKLTDKDRERIDSMLALSGAEAWRLHKRGELIAVENDQLARTSDLLRGTDEDRAKVTATLKRYEEALARAQKQADEGDLTERTVAKHDVEVFTARIRGLRDSIAEWRAETSRSADQGARQGRELAALAKTIPTVTAETQDLAEAQDNSADALDSMADSVASLRDELAAIGLTEEQQAEFALAKRRESVEAAARAALEVEGLTADQVEQIHAEREEALRLIALIGAKERAVAAAEEEHRSAKEAEDEAVRTEAARQDRVSRLYEDAVTSRLTEAEKLERQFQLEVLPDLANASAEEREAIEAMYYEKIAELREGEEVEQVSFFTRLGQASRSTWSAMAAGARAVGAAFSALRGAGETVLGIVEKLTGFSFSLADGMSAVTQALADASVDEEGNAIDLSPEQVASIAADAGRSFVEELVNNATDFMLALVAALPELIQGLVDSIPTLLAAIVEGFPAIIQALVDGIPVLVSELMAALPTLISTLAAAIPDLISAFLAQLPTIIQGLIEALPPLIAALLEGLYNIVAFLADTLPTMITNLMSGLPVIIEQILGAVPEIITRLLGAIPDIIRAVVNGIPDIITAILGSLPDIIIALIDGIILAIPEIIVSIIEAIPQIVVSITQAIPGIIMAVVGRIPMIIETIIGAIPTIIFALIDAFPTIIVAIVELIPTLVLAIIAAVPEIIVALFTAFFVELPRQLPAIVVELVKALVEAIKGALVAVKDVVADWFKSILGGKKDKDGEAEDPAGAYSGVNYVPATMRMTVHQGEAIVPASRNPARRGSTTDPALAGAMGFQGGGQGGGFGTLALDVVLGGQIVDRVVVDATRAGHAPGITRMLRREAGTQVGFDSGRFSRWNK